MRSITITKTHGGSYIVSDGRNVSGNLTWDEMLGVFCRWSLLDLPVPRWMFEPMIGEVRGVDYELCVTKIDRTYHLIELEDRFADHMTFDEALGFLALFTRTGQALYGGLRTYAEHLAEPYCSYAKRPIAGMLPAPITL